MSASGKDAPRGALEEAVALFDELRRNVIVADVMTFSGVFSPEALADLDSRRAALEPRLAKRRENQAKGRDPERELGPPGRRGEGWIGGPPEDVLRRESEAEAQHEPARRRDDQAKARPGRETKP